MMTPHSKYITVNGLEFHYTEWGSAAKPPLVLWHGFARTGRDFDDLAAALVSDWHIFAPDTIGRGLSQWSPDPQRDYDNGAFEVFATGFLDGLRLGVVDWVGTSMGGGIGMRTAAKSLKGRIKRLVMNDIGPQINEAAVQRIRNYAGAPPVFDRVSELETYFREIYASFGALTDMQWRRLTETSVRRLPDGRVTTHYDPKITIQFTDNHEDYAQWSLWDAVECEVLCLHGEDSTLLLAPYAEAMMTRGPRCRVVTIKGCGHAPFLNVPEQINLVADFLHKGL